MDDVDVLLDVAAAHLGPTSCAASHERMTVEVTETLTMAWLAAADDDNAETESGAADDDLKNASS